jgi:tetratricopeptide (TPR) repeat protein
MMTRISSPAKTGNATRMRTTAIRLCVLLVLAACLATIDTESVVAQARGYMIWGDVNVHVSRTEDLPGPARVNLTLYNRVGRLVGRQTVTPHGRYRFTNLSAGEYELAVEIENSEITRIYFNLGGSIGADYRQDLQFEWKARRSQAKSKPGTISAADAYSRSAANQTLFEKAEEATDKKKYEQAVMFLRQVVDNDMLDFQAWALLGAVYTVQQRPAEAESAYLNALTARPAFAMALIALGRLHSNQKKFAEAIDPLSKALQVQPKSGEANLLLGEAYIQLKKGSTAVPYLNEAAKNGKPEAHLRLGWLYNAAGMKDKAAAEYEEFLKKKPDYSDRKKLEEYISANKKG